MRETISSSLNLVILKQTTLTESALMADITRLRQFVCFLVYIYIYIFFTLLRKGHLLRRVQLPSSAQNPRPVDTQRWPYLSWRHSVIKSPFVPYHNVTLNQVYSQYETSDGARDELKSLAG